MPTIDFFVPGRPATAGSKTPYKNKKTGKVYLAPANKQQKPWMLDVKRSALEHYKNKPLLTTAVILDLVFYLSRPKIHFGTGKNKEILKESAPVYHITRPDLNKMVRAIEDALTGIIWKDDSQICSFSSKKIYANSCPGVVITIKWENENLGEHQWMIQA